MGKELEIELEELEVKHTWRDSIFRYIFKEEEKFVEMYEVFTGIKLLPEEIEFRNTDSIVMSKDLKNDVAFITKDGKFIVLVEHQSTKCPNMALRLLIYYSEFLKIYIKKHELNIYGTKPIEYPKAEFYIAYNGETPWLSDDEIDTGDNQTDAGDTQIVAGDVTINVKIVDINYDNLEVKERDNTLSGYAYLVRQYQYYKYIKRLTSQYAVDKALKDCRNEGYLDDYVDKEEFLSMITDVWTIEQQFIDRERWATERAEKKSEAKVAKAEEKAAKAEAKVAKAEEKAAKAEAKTAKAEAKTAKAEAKTAKAELLRKEDKLDTVKRLLKMGLSNIDAAEGAGVDLDVVLEVSKDLE